METPQSNPWAPWALGRWTAAPHSPLSWAPWPSPSPQQPPPGLSKSMENVGINHMDEVTNYVCNLPKNSPVFSYIPYIYKSNNCWENHWAKTDANQQTYAGIAPVKPVKIMRCAWFAWYFMKFPLLGSWGVANWQSSLRMENPDSLGVYKSVSGHGLIIGLYCINDRMSW